MLDMSLAPRMEARITPALINFAEMLMLSGAALHQLVQQELGENPALEELEGEDEHPLSEAALLRQLEPHFDAGSSSTAPDEAPDRLLLVAAPRSLAEHLLSDVRASLPPHDHPIAALLVESLDEHGFLPDDVPTLAGTLGVEPQRVAAVVQRLQELGPPGIATPNVQACLLAQLEHLAASGISHPHAHAVVRHHLDDLGAHRYQQIARQVRCSPATVEDVRDFVQQHCWPYPAQMVAAAGVGDRPRYTQPDVLITAQQDGSFQAEVLHAPRRMLRLSPLYDDLAQQADKLDEDEREHVRAYVERTRMFLANLHQRHATLQQISTEIIRYQQAFLRQGVRHLLPLTRAEIAAEMGLHESTVSRAIAHKTVVLPNGSLMPFADFFHAARPVQAVLRELVAQETDPLSDSDLARLLTERGYPVARRTVAKYRDQLHILPYHLRSRSTSRQAPADPPESPREHASS